MLRAHWLLISISVLVCTGLAGALAWTRPPTYAAETQLYVSTSFPSSGVSSTERYAAILLSQQRAVSYTQLIASPPVLQAINNRLGLSLSLEEFRAKVSAVRPDGTVLINLTVTDRSPQLARAIAQAAAIELPRFLESLEGKQTSPVKVSVTSPAQLPTQPVSPQKKLYLVLGMILGLVIGVGAAVIREALSRRIRDAEDVVALTGLPVLGSIAERRRARSEPLIMLNRPSSARAEEYRRVRTNLHALIGESERRSLVVSSATPGEGKTLIVANLGVAFAQAGHRVVLVDADLRHRRALVDADLRRSSLADAMGLAPARGLSDLLKNNLPVEHALASRPDLPLEVLAAGAPPENPSELLGSRRFAAVLDELSMRADLVILDMPPLLPTTDAAVVARLTAGVVLVARAGSTRSNQLVSAVESLLNVEARVLGVIVNRLPPRSAAQQYGGAYESQPDPSGERNLAPELAGEAAVPLGAGPTSRA